MGAEHEKVGLTEDPELPLGQTGFHRGLGRSEGDQAPGSQAKRDTA